MVDRTKRQTRWYFGGFASAGAACCTHPLDLIKVFYVYLLDYILVVTSIKVYSSFRVLAI